jgi:hypothetical protein
MKKQQQHLKLPTSLHRVVSADVCHEVWVTEGDSWDLAGRYSSNLRSQNLRRPAERRRCRHPAAPHRRHPAAPHRQRLAAPPTAVRRHPAAPPPPSYGCAGGPPPRVLVPPPTIFVQQPAIKCKQLSTDKKICI